VDSGWLGTNPASKIKNPVITEPPTMPYEPEQVDAIVRAAGAVSVRLQLFVLVLRYSGLRISDAVQLKPDRIQNGRLFPHTQKTGVVVNVALPPFLVARLTALPLFDSGYWFWNRQQDGTKLETATGNMRRALRAVFKKAGVEDGHPHRFRDTFAVEFLKLPEATLEQLQQLLGHKSIKITEKHYAPWVQSRQDQLDRVVRQGWENAAGESLGRDPTEGLPARP
jgi:integrase